MSYPFNAKNIRSLVISLLFLVVMSCGMGEPEITLENVSAAHCIQGGSCDCESIVPEPDDVDIEFEE